MLTGVTRPFDAPHALFTPSTGGTSSLNVFDDSIRLPRSVT